MSPITLRNKPPKNQPATLLPLFPAMIGQAIMLIMFKMSPIIKAISICISSKNTLVSLLYRSVDISSMYCKFKKEKDLLNSEQVLRRDFKKHGEVNQADEGRELPPCRPFVDHSRALQPKLFCNLLIGITGSFNDLIDLSSRILSVQPLFAAHISTSWNEHLVWKGRINCVIIIPWGADFVNRSPALPRYDSLCRNMHCRSCNHFIHSTGEWKCTGSSFFNAAAFGYAKEFHVAIFSMIFKVIVLVSISTLCKCSFRRFSVGSFIIIIPHIIAEQCKTGAKQITKKRKRCQIYGFYKNVGGGGSLLLCFFCG